MLEPQTLMSGLAFGESPRWHDDRLWFSDWGAHEVIAVDLKGESEVIVRVPSFPMCIGFLPDGRLLIVSATVIQDEIALAMKDDDASKAALQASIGAAGNVRTQTLRAFSQAGMKGILAKLG